MKKEIEKKFLVKNNQWKFDTYKHIEYTQGYFGIIENNNSISSCRIRIYNKKAKLCVKYGNIFKKDIKIEFEYKILYKDAIFMLKKICLQPLIKKTRYFLKYENNIWEVDVFHDENNGLIVAEIELSELIQKIELPNWIGEEVTNNKKYFNINLIKLPFSKW